MQIRLSKEEPGFILSLVVHVSLLVIGLLGFADAKPFEDAQESVPVEMISADEMRQLTQGEKTAKQVLPDAKLRVDRIAPELKQDDPGERKQDVAAPNPPPQLPPERPIELSKVEPVKAEPPKAEPPKAEPPKPVPLPPVVSAPALPPARPVELAKAEVKKVALAQPSQDDTPDPDAEVIRQAAKKSPIPLKQDAPKVDAKPDQAAKEAAAKAAEQQRLEDARKAEEAKKAELKKQAEAKAKAEAEEKAKEAREAAKREEAREKAAEAKAAAEEQAKAEAKAKAEAEAKKKALAAKAAAEAEHKRQAEFNKLLRARLASASSEQTGGNGRQVPSERVASSTGSTGAQVNRNASSLGAPTATGSRLNPAERMGLSEAVADQVSPKVSYSGSKPKVLPQFKVHVGRDGSLLSQPELANHSNEPNFQALAQAGARAIRLAAPFRIEPRYASSYGDWEYMIIQINPDL